MKRVRIELGSLAAAGKSIRLLIPTGASAKELREMLTKLREQLLDIRVTEQSSNKDRDPFDYKGAYLTTAGRLDELRAENAKLRQLLANQQRSPEQARLEQLIRAYELIRNGKIGPDAAA